MSRMRASLRRAGLAGLLVLTLAVVAEPAGAAAPAPITPIDLGTFGGEAASVSTINNRGQVVGWMQTAEGRVHPFLWHRGAKTDLGTLGGDEGVASDVNERGHVVGNSVTATGERHAFLWRDGTMTDLGTLGGTFSSATFVDGKDQVFGRSFAADGTNQPFVWSGGVMRPLSAPGWTELGVSDVSESGYAVGGGRNPDGVRQAFVWYRGVLTGLPSLEPGTTSSAQFVNERGQALGLVFGPATGQHRTVTWTGGRVTQVSDSGAEPGGINDQGSVVGMTGADQAFLLRCRKLTLLRIGTETSWARWLNNRDDVVVQATGEQPARFFLWRRGTARQLAGLTPDSEVRIGAINDRGQVVGASNAPESNPRAVLWNT
jgi:probable HAF family extracellular repeat protein